MASQRFRRAPERQVADVEVPHAERAQLAEGPGADVHGVAPAANSAERRRRHRQEPASVFERRRLGAAVVEHPEDRRAG